MTIQSTDRKAGPFLSGTALPFEFKVFSKEDIAVIYTNAEGVEVVLVLDSDYSVTLNADQDNNPGGTATLTTPIVSGDRANIIGDLAYDQGTDIRNQGGFEPEIIEDALDRATIQIQQLKEISDRTLKTAPGDSRTGDELLADIFEAEESAAASAAAAEESANRVDLGALDDAVAQTQADVVTTTTQAGIATTQAGIAMAQAGIATDQALISTANANSTAGDVTAAEAARDAAFVNADVYADTAAGLAATVDPEQFQVVEGDEIVRYENDGGVAVEVARYPAAELVLGTVERDNSDHALHVFTDDQGQVVGSFTQDGFELPGVEITLNDAVQFTPRETFGDYTHVFADADGRSTLGLRKDGRIEDSRIGALQDAFAGLDLITGLEQQALGNESLARLNFDRAKWKNRTPLRIQQCVFGALDDPLVSGARFPQALPLSDTTGLFVFTQKALVPVGNSENGQRLVVCDYEIDYELGTITTSPIRVIEQPALWLDGKGYASEPSLIKLDQGPNIGRIILIYRVDNSVDQLLSPPIYDFYTRFSDDDGQTWSARTLAVDRAGFNHASAAQLISLPNGRLVYAIYRGPPPRFQGALLSDDFGVTWFYSSLAQNLSRTWSEPAILRKENGDLLLLVRSDTDTGLLERGIFRSTDNGSSWFFDGISTEAAFGNSNTGLISTDNEMGFSKAFACSTANPLFFRRTMFRFRVSYDEGETFPGEWAPFSEKQLTGYSQLSRLGSDKLLLAYETASPTDPTNPDGDINSRNAVHLLVINLAEVFYNVSAS